MRTGSHVDHVAKPEMMAWDMMWLVLKLWVCILSVRWNLNVPHSTPCSPWNDRQNKIADLRYYLILTIVLLMIIFQRIDATLRT